MTKDVAHQLTRLVAGESLGAAETGATIGAMMDARLDETLAAEWLTALAGKGESLEEIVGAAEAMRARSLRVHSRRDVVLDVCGTGGDGLHTVNISTAVAFVVAACGVPVAKHGNRASSSRCGSADVLEALGVHLDQSPVEAAAVLDAGGVAFLFAQQYHPAMRAVAPLRKALGIRTIFNLLGPLTNPAGATHQVIGVARSVALETIAAAAMRLGIRAGAIVHAANGLDEIAGDVSTTVVRFKGGVLQHELLHPTDFNIAAPTTALRGGDAAENAAALLAILNGEFSPRADVVALNAAYALLIAERVASLSAGLAAARRALRNGTALSELTRLRATGHATA